MRNSGFTLLETVIYIAILSGMTLFLVLLSYQIFGSNRETRTRLTVVNEARFTMNKIEWALLGVQSINQPASGSSSSTLSINRYGAADNPIVFDLFSGTLRLKRGGDPPIALMGSEVAVSSVSFENVAPSGSLPRAVAVNFSVISLRQDLPVAISTTLSNVIYLR